MMTFKLCDHGNFQTEGIGISLSLMMKTGSMTMMRKTVMKVMMILTTMMTMPADEPFDWSCPAARLVQRRPFRWAAFVGQPSVQNSDPVNYLAFFLLTS